MNYLLFYRILLIIFTIPLNTSPDIGNSPHLALAPVHCIVDLPDWRVRLGSCSRQERPDLVQTEHKSITTTSLLQSIY